MWKTFVSKILISKIIKRLVTLNVFLTFIGSCKYIRQDVTLQIYFCNAFYIIPSIISSSKLHQVLVIQILLA